MRKRNKDGTFAVEHGQADTRLHIIWMSMRDRCSNPKHSRYPRYGGRGIKVCEEWHSFVPFYEWAIANGYDDTLTIDRVDPNGNYEPGNCRWVSNSVQQNNRCNNIRVSYAGETHTISDWARITGINYFTLRFRIKQGMPLERAFTKGDLREK